MQLHSTYHSGAASVAEEEDDLAFLYTANRLYVTAHAILHASMAAVVSLACLFHKASSTSK